MSTCNHRALRTGRLRLIGALLLCVAPASAQVDKQAAARSLFNEARTLMKAGKYENACPKLEAASRLYTGSGLLLNLGDCYEHEGRTASAWTEFGEAASVAERTGRADDQSEALLRQSALEPKLSRLVIQVKESAQGMVVKRDDLALDEGAWGVAIPVDPGTHAVSAAASGRTPWTRSIAVTEAGSSATVEVPPLKPLPPPADAAPGPTATTQVPLTTPLAQKPPYWNGRRIGGAVTVGLGLAGAGVGGLMGLAALSQYNTAKAESGTSRHNDSVSADRSGNVATVVACVGGAIAATGLVLWLTKPSAPVQVGTAGTAAFLRGAF